MGGLWKAQVTTLCGGEVIWFLFFKVVEGHLAPNGTNENKSKNKKKERQVAKADEPLLDLKPEGELIQRLRIAHFSSHHLLSGHHMPGRLDPALGKVMDSGTDRTVNGVSPEQTDLSRVTHTWGPEHE